MPPVYKEVMVACNADPNKRNEKNLIKFDDDIEINYYYLASGKDLIFFQNQTRQFRYGNNPHLQMHER